MTRTLQALFAEARKPKGSGPFHFPLSTSLCIGTGSRPSDRITGNGARSLTSCRETASVLAESVLQFLRM